jgi:hypothetical protein
VRLPEAAGASSWSAGSRFPARSEDARWRAVWYEAGERQQCEAPTQEKLSAKLEKVKIRLEADAGLLVLGRGEVTGSFLMAALWVAWNRSACTEAWGRHARCWGLRWWSARRRR